MPHLINACPRVVSGWCIETERCTDNILTTRQGVSTKGDVSRRAWWIVAKEGERRIFRAESPAMYQEWYNELYDRIPKRDYQVDSHAS